MITQIFSADVAAERRRDFITRADAYRLGRQARRRPSSRLYVKVRPLRSSDSRLLGDVFDGLSAQSRLSRFLAPKPQLDDRQVRMITGRSGKDGAVVAVTRWGGEGIGVAEWIRDKSDPTVAEICAAVTDEWQSRGLGTRLARALADQARREGIVAFTALTERGNVRVRHVLAGLGDVRVVDRDGATITYRVELYGAAAPRGPQPAGAVDITRRWFAHAQLGPVHNYVAQ
jgi:GNAT superfamily N-acetyltransferase